MSARDPLHPPRAAPGVPPERCPRCVLHLHLCLCAAIEPLDVATRVVVLRHRREVHKPTNTGRLAGLALRSGEVRDFGGRGFVFGTQGWLHPDERALLLYPGPDSRELTRADAGPGPLTLLVPDADWRRAFKLAHHEPALAHVPRVHLPPGPPSRYRLRCHTDPRFVATFEAVARALGILEGAAVQARLEAVFDLMVARVLRSRGLHAGDDA